MQGTQYGTSATMRRNAKPNLKHDPAHMRLVIKEDATTTLLRQSEHMQRSLQNCKHPHTYALAPASDLATITLIAISVIAHLCLTDSLYRRMPSASTKSISDQGYARTSKCSRTSNGNISFLFQSKWSSTCLQATHDRIM